MIEEKAGRNQAIDGLKSISMIMVILMHATYYGIQNMDIEPLSSINIMTGLLGSFSLVAVNCFVLITGYCSSRSKKTNYGRLISLWIQVLMYSAGVYLAVVLCTGHARFRINTLIMKCLPILTNQYWFFTVYMLLMIIKPYLDILICSMDRKTYVRLLVSLWIVFSVIPSINIFGDTFGTNRGFSLIWFAVLYLSAAYLQRYPLQKRAYGLYYLGLSALVFIVKLMNQYVQIKHYPVNISTILDLQMQYNSPIALFASVSLLLFAVNHPIAPDRFRGMLTRIASMSFSVYLLHENGAIRDVLWNEWVCLDKVGSNALCFGFRIVVSTVLIFTVGIFIEWIRRLVLSLIMTRKTESTSGYYR